MNSVLALRPGAVDCRISMAGKFLMKKNVLQLIGSFHQGGSERQAVQLTRLLRRDKTYNVRLAALNSEGVLKPEVESLGLTDIPEFKLNSFYDLNFFKQLRKCARFIKENNFEIVHAHDFYTNVFGIAAARLANVKLKIASKRETFGMRTNAQNLVEKRVFNFADRIVVNSEAVKNYLIAEKIRAEKIRVIYNGLDLQRLEPQKFARREICETLGLPLEGRLKFVTLVANLRHTVKNQPMFLRTAKRVAEKIPESHFVLAGEGALKTDLKNFARELNVADRTHFIGRCTRVPELLSISSVGVLTSFAEGFSNSLLEYMAAGLPVVATNVGGAAEAIIENETGFLIESDDDAAMANRLIELLENEAKIAGFGEKGRQTVKEKFSLETQLEKTLELYESR